MILNDNMKREAKELVKKWFEKVNFPMGNLSPTQRNLRRVKLKDSYTNDIFWDNRILEYFDFEMVVKPKENLDGNKFDNLLNLMLKNYKTTRTILAEKSKSERIKRILGERTKTTNKKASILFSEMRKQSRQPVYQLAKNIGANPSEIYKIELGKTSPSYKISQKYYDYFSSSFKGKRTLGLLNRLKSYLNQ